jgi:hypothetical protein
LAYSWHASITQLTTAISLHLSIIFPTIQQTHQYE